MEKSFTELLIDKTKSLSTSDQVAQEALYKLIMGESVGFTVDMKEAMTTRDFPQLVQNVINDKILLPIEPEYIGQSILAQTIPVARASGTYTYPSFGHLTAQEIGETQEYPEVAGELNRTNYSSVVIRKFGIQLGISEELLEGDEIGLWGIHIQAAKLAMNRKKEEVIFAAFQDITKPVFDNLVAWPSLANEEVDAALGDPADTDWNTHGLGVDGTFNATLHIYDLLDAMGILMARGYNPTDMLVNPLAWSMFARMPIMNGFHPYTFGTSSNLTSMYTAKDPSSMNGILSPWGINILQTPFISVNRTVGANCPFLTDLYLGSRKRGIIILQGTPLQQEAYRSIERDIYRVRLKEKYGVGLADQGRGWTSIKNVRIAESYEMLRVKTVT
jgi:hypothetical protein